MTEDQEIRAAAIQAAATLYGHYAGANPIQERGEPQPLDYLAAQTQRIARDFERYIAGPPPRTPMGKPPRRPSA